MSRCQQCDAPLPPRLSKNGRQYGFTRRFCAACKAARVRAYNAERARRRKERRTPQEVARERAWNTTYSKRRRQLIKLAKQALA